MIVEEIDIEVAGHASKKHGGEKECYYKILIKVWDRYWEWQPNNKRLSLEEAIKIRDDFKKRMGY